MQSTVYDTAGTRHILIERGTQHAAVILQEVRTAGKGGRTGSDGRRWTEKRNASNEKKKLLCRGGSGSHSASLELLRDLLCISRRWAWRDAACRPKWNCTCTVRWSFCEDRMLRDSAVSSDQGAAVAIQ